MESFRTWRAMVLKSQTAQLCCCSSLVTSALAPLALLFRLETEGEALIPVPMFTGVPSNPGTPLVEAVSPVLEPPTCGPPAVPGGFVRRAMSARTALIHFISSSSLGALSRSERFVSTILKVNCAPSTSWASSPDLGDTEATRFRGGDDADEVPDR